MRESLNKWDSEKPQSICEYWWRHLQKLEESSACFVFLREGFMVEVTGQQHSSRSCATFIHFIVNNHWRMQRSPGSKGKAGMKSNKTTNCSRLDLPARNLQGPGCSKSSVLGLKHWPLMPAGTGSNELISNSLVMNPAAHCELPTEHGWGFKSCESAKGSLELFKICNCMELGEQDELKKSFYWQSPCYTYRYFRWSTSFKRLCWLWWMNRSGICKIQGSKTAPFRRFFGKNGKNLGIPVRSPYWHSCRYLCSLPRNQG